MVEQKVLQDFVDGLKPDEKEVNDIHTAIVSRIDDEGVVWVNINGSDKETPTELVATEVKRGDAVTVQWRNNKLYIASNYTNPSAGVVRVSAVEAAAQTANTAANNAVDDAGRAKEAAEDAIATAESVHGIAEHAAEDAADAKQSANNASEYAARALGNLSTVQSVAETLNWITQHGTMTITTDTALDPTHVYFVRDNNGDYEVGNYRYSVVAEPDVSDISTYYELSIDESLNNYVGTHLAVTSEGLWILPEGLSASSYKILIATGGQGHTYEEAGTYIIDSAGKTVAKLGEKITLGIEDGTQSFLQLDFHSLKMTDKEGNNYVYMSDFRSAAGIATITTEFIGDGQRYTFSLLPPANTTDYEVTVDDGSGGTITKHKNLVSFYRPPHKEAVITVTYTSESDYCKAYTFGKRDSTPNTIGAYSVAEGVNIRASGPRSHAEGYGTKAKGYNSHAEGNNTKAFAPEAHAEGVGTTASGWDSHAEGSGSQASGDESHAEGSNTKATGQSSHAEGSTYTEASGFSSHAEGRSTLASGDYSHAQNNFTIAAKEAQTAIGRFNLEDTETNVDKQKALIIGNGTNYYSARSNALTVDWQGNTWMAGSVTENNGTRDIDLQISETTIQAFVDLGMSLK